MRAVLALGLLLAFLTAAAAQGRDDRYFVAWGATSLDVTRAMRCPPPHCQRAQPRRHPRKRAVAQRRSLVRGLVAEVGKALPVKGLTGVVPALAAKASEIVTDCGSSVISGVRHTYVAGTRRISLHASGRAVDLAGNPGCIYRHLAGWPGGYSTDYARVRHVHISYDPHGRREWGARFAHGGHHRMYAHRHGRVLSARRHYHRRYARRA